MAGGTRDLLVRFLGDSAGLKKATNDADAATDKFSTNLKNLAGTVAAAYATKQIIEFGKASVEAAVEDEASQVKLATALRNTVGANAAVIASTEAFIAEMQDTTGTADDVLRPAFARLVTSTRDVGEAQSLMQLAMDISAGTGKDLQTVAEGLSKANDGNVSALKRLGLQTTDAEGKTLSFEGAVKSLSDTFDGQADAAAQTNAGKMAILKARYGELQETVGKALLPILTQFVGVLSGLVGWFSSLDEGTQEWIVRIAILGGGLLLAGRAVSGISDAMKAFSGMTSLASKAAGALNVSTGQMSVGLGVLGGALAVVGLAFMAVKSHQESMANLNTFMEAQFAELNKVVDAKVWVLYTAGLKTAKMAGDSLNQANKNLAESNIEGARRVLSMAAANGASQEQIESLTEAIEWADARTAQAAKTSAEYATVADTMTESVNRAGEAAREGTGLMQDYTQSVSHAGEAAREGHGTWTLLRNVTDDLARAADSAGRAIDAQKAAFDRMTGAINADQALINLDDQFADLEVAASEAWTAASTNAADASEKARAHKTAINDTKLAVISYGHQIGLLPSEVNTLLDMVDNGQIADVERRINYAARSRDVALRLVASGGYTGTILVSGGPRAHGGPTYGGAIHEVAEKGRPELLSEGGRTYLIPGGDGFVTPLSTASTGGGAWSPSAPTINIYVGGSVVAEKDLTRSIYDAIIDGQRRGELVGSLA